MGTKIYFLPHMILSALQSAEVGHTTARQCQQQSVIALWLSAEKYSVGSVM